MRRGRLALAVIAALAVGAAWPSGFAAAGIRPDLLVLLVVAAALLGRGDTGAVVGIVAGLAAAPLSVEPFGLDAALLGAVGLVAGRLGAYLRADHAGVQAAMAGGAALAVDGARLLRLEVAVADASTTALLPAVLLSAATTAALAPLALPLVARGRLFAVPDAGAPGLRVR